MKIPRSSGGKMPDAGRLETITEKVEREHREIAARILAEQEKYPPGSGLYEWSLAIQRKYGIAKERQG